MEKEFVHPSLEGLKVIGVGMEDTKQPLWFLVDQCCTDLGVAPFLCCNLIIQENNIGTYRTLRSSRDLKNSTSEGARMSRDLPKAPALATRPAR